MTGKLRIRACFFCIRSRAATAPTASPTPPTTRVSFMSHAYYRPVPVSMLSGGTAVHASDPGADDVPAARREGNFRLMDLIPKPDQVASAASNVAHKLIYGGLADLRPMPRTLIDDGMLREVYHYRPVAKTRETGDPVLLVTPLAAPSLCFDLRRGCSLVEHFVQQGRPTYLVEYGQVAFKDRNLGMEHWVSEVLPEAIREVSRHAGGRPVHLIGWSLGGIFSLLTAAAWSSLPIGSVTTVGSPIDIRQVPLIAPVRPLLGVVPDRASIITLAYRAMGGVPQPLVRRAFQLSAFDKLITKP